MAGEIGGQRTRRLRRHIREGVRSSGGDERQYRARRDACSCAEGRRMAFASAFVAARTRARIAWREEGEVIGCGFFDGLARRPPFAKGLLRECAEIARHASSGHREQGRRVDPAVRGAREDAKANAAEALRELEARCIAQKTRLAAFMPRYMGSNQRAGCVRSWSTTCARSSMRTSGMLILTGQTS